MTKLDLLIVKCNIHCNEKIEIFQYDMRHWPEFRKKRPLKIFSLDESRCDKR